MQLTGESGEKEGLAEVSQIIPDAISSHSLPAPLGLAPSSGSWSLLLAQQPLTVTTHQITTAQTPNVV